MRAAAFAVALAACADLPPIAANRCGNGVLEAGEDCDTPDPRCVACGWTCTSDADCAALPGSRDPSAYRCGVDDFCHAPGGVFPSPGSPSTRQPFDVDRMYVTDIDHDGIGDVVGLGSTSLVTRFGDTAARLDGSASTVTPDVTGFEAIVHIDDDESLDLVLPTHDGIVAFASPNHLLAPYALAVNVAVVQSLFRPLALIPLDRTHVGVIAASLIAHTLVLGTVDASLRHVQLLDLCQPDFQESSFDASTLFFYDASVPGGAAAVTAAFVATDSTGTQQLCAFSIANQNGTITGVAAASIAPPASAVFGDFAGDHCPSLVTANLGLTSIAQYVSARDGSGNCEFPASPLSMTAIASEPADARLVGSVPLVPLPGGLAGDALVTSDEIIGVSPNGAGYPLVLYQSDRPIDMVRSGDFNGDGKLDAIAASSAGPNFDMLMRSSSPDTFLRLRVGTDFAPSSPVVGDFDGNGVDDVLYIEQVGGGDRMSAIYSTLDQPLPPTAVGAFYDLLSAVPVDLVDSYDRDNLVRDLAVLDQRRNAPNTTLEVLYGSPQRAMLPFLDPELTHTSVFRTVAAGNITSATRTDMVTIDNDPTYPNPYTLFAQDMDHTIEYAGNGRRNALAGVNDCSSGAPLCFDQARSVVWACGAATNNEMTCGQPATSVVVVIDPGDGVSTVFDPQCCGPASGAPCMPMPASTSGPTLVGATITTPPVFADTDGDGVPELIVASTTDAGGQVASCLLDGCHTGASLSCTDVLAAVPDRTGKCTGATLGRVDPSGAISVVLECSDGLYRLTHGASGYGAEQLLPVALPLAVAVGDVTGDGVDDIVITTPVGDVRELAVYPQLTSRQAAP